MDTRVRLTLDYITYLVSVPKCACCKERLTFEENALCSRCVKKYEEVKNRSCSRCGKILNRCCCSNDFLERHFVKKVVKVFRYKQREENISANSLIYSLKRDNRSDVLKLCSTELSEAIVATLGDVGDYIITNVPRRKKAITDYGIDHSALLAKSVSKLTGSTYISILKSNAKKPQKHLYGNDRYANADFEIKRDIDLCGKRVIIVDDIITTGASTSACAMLLKGLGAKSIYAAALAVAYNEDFGL